MSTAITKIVPEEKRIYDFRPDYVKDQISLIKKTFSKRCLEDNRLSDEYKAHIKDLDNIFVKLTPVYGFDCKLSLYSVSANVSYTYVLSYVSSTTVSGTASVNSSGDVKLSNVHTTDHYSSSRTQKTTSASWYSSAKDSCIMRVGGAAHSGYDLKNYEDVTDKKRIPAELAKMASAPITYGFLNPYITPSSIPGNVRASLIDDATGFHKNDSPKDIKIDSVTNYGVDELWITYLPYTYEFDVWCEFEGEVYKHHCKKISEITSVGKLSDHYEKYKELVADQRYDFFKKLRGVRILYALSIFISALGVLGLISLLAFGKQLHVEGLRYFYLFPMIASCAAAVAMAVVGIVMAKKERPLCVRESDYDPDKPHALLGYRLRENAKRQRRRFVTHALLFLAAVFLVFGGLATGALFMGKDVYAEHFLYTPEIIGTYYGYEDGVFDKLTILSCDSEGKVEAISESTYKEHYAKSKEIGQIIKKDRDGLQIKFTLAEALYQPKTGSFEELSYATFSSDCLEITDYSDVTMVKEEIWSQQGHASGNGKDAQLGAYYLYSKNTLNMLEIKSFDGNGGVSFTSTTVSASGYSEKQGEGKLLIVNPDGSCFVDFQMAGVSQVAYIPADGQTIIAGNEYAKSQHNIVFIDSTSDLLRISDTPANPRLYVLTKDLDFEGQSISFIPSLSGMLLGNGHTIKNFVLSSGFNSSAGLFGTVYTNAVICDLIIENGRLETTKGLSYAGLLCGYLNGSIIRVTASGTVSAPNATNVGGLVGKSTSTGKTIECNHTVSVNP
ncbi:MAG: hypothetical protein IJA78_00850 [Clostridia bacterium]|nr:hypothetical protein [Clostridia bacterium]